MTTTDTTTADQRARALDLAASLRAMRRAGAAGGEPCGPGGRRARDRRAGRAGRAASEGGTMTPVASGRMAATHAEWAASPITAALTDDEWGQLARVIIEHGEVLMADVPPRVVAVYMSLPPDEIEAISDYPCSDADEWRDEWEALEACNGCAYESSRRCPYATRGAA